MCIMKPCVNVYVPQSIIVRPEEIRKRSKAAAAKKSNLLLVGRARKPEKRKEKERVWHKAR